MQRVVEKYPFMEKAVKIAGQRELYPPQLEAIKAGVLEGENLLLASGTGSGKTLIAELAALAQFLKHGKKTVYVVPLRALAAEKYEEFKKYEPLGLKVALSMGNLDSADQWLEKYDVVVATAEKLDSLLRHQADWLHGIGLLVADEIHELGGNRGATLETLIIKMRRFKPQVLALSATVGNAKEIAKWLGAKCIISNFRPVPLKEGVYHNSAIEFTNETKKVVSTVSAPEISLVEDALRNKEESLCFLNTRRSAEATAERAALVVRKFLTVTEKKELAKVAKEILGVLDRPTDQCTRLAKVIADGSAFHHAGLAHGQRVLVEDAFRNGLLKFLASTVTLVAGVNLPAHRIIIKSLQRFDDGGSSAWSVGLYKQAAGRAGRVKYDTEGEAVTIAKSESEAEQIKETYINGTPEDANSQLASESALRVHTLGVLASGFAGDRKSLNKFFGESFHALQSGRNLESITEKVLGHFQEWGFVKPFSQGFVELGQTNQRIELTPVGRRVAQLYIDPLTAWQFMQAKPKETRDYLYLFANTNEMQPNPSVRKKDEEVLEVAEKFGIQPWDFDSAESLRAVKAALIFGDWIEERSEQELFEKWGIAPGDLRNRLLNIDWLSYAYSELCRLTNKRGEFAESRKLQYRLQTGVKEELLKLVEAKGIGRVRARRLFGNGIKDLDELKKNREKATRLLGTAAIKILDELK